MGLTRITKSTALLLLGILTLLTLSSGCWSKDSQKGDVGRFQLVFPPPQSKSPALAYIIDTATGRLWSRGVSREEKRADGESFIEYSDWTETKIKGLND